MNHDSHPLSPKYSAGNPQHHNLQLPLPPNFPPPPNQQHPQHHPADMSFYAQMDPKNPFGIFQSGGGGGPIGFHHNPFSLVPNPTSNPLLQQHVDPRSPPPPPQPSEQQQNNNCDERSREEIYYLKKNRIKEEFSEGSDGAGSGRSHSHSHANSLRDKQKIIFDAAGKKMYACTLCDYSTKQKGQLKVHINSEHYKMKIFNCDLCKFTSVQKGNLRAHIITVHEKLRNFPCEFCEYRAGTKGILKTHVKNKHLRLEKETFDCTLCPFKALRRCHLKEHLKSEHR